MRLKFGKAGEYNPPYRIQLSADCHHMYPELAGTEATCIFRQPGGDKEDRAYGLYLVYINAEYDGHSGATYTELFVKHPIYANHCMWIAGHTFKVLTDIIDIIEEGFYQEYLDGSG